MGDYWSGARIDQIANVMSLKRFQKLRRFLYFNDNDQIKDQTKDRYYKIRPLLEGVRENCYKHQFENQYWEFKLRSQRHGGY